MSPILKDFWKKNVNITICTALQVLLCPLLILTKLDEMRGKPVGMLLILLLAFAIICGIWSLAKKFIFTPIKLKRQLNSMPESERKSLLSQYPQAKKIDSHVFLEKYLLVSGNERLHLLRYDDIISVQKHRDGLKIMTVSCKKPIFMMFYELGANAVTAAYIKNKNPKAKMLGSAD